MILVRQIDPIRSDSPLPSSVEGRRHTESSPELTCGKFRGGDVHQKSVKNRYQDGGKGGGLSIRSAV